MRKYIIYLLTACFICMTAIVMTGCDDDNVEITFVSESTFSIFVYLNGEYVLGVIVREPVVVLSEFEEGDIITVERGVDRSPVTFLYEGMITTTITAQDGMTFTIYSDGLNGKVTR